jgi:O-antigen/teichoic acid export membrane protein
VGAYIAGSLLAATCIVWWARPVLAERGDGIDWGEIKRFALPLMLFTGSFMLFYCLDTILSKSLLGATAAGHYAAALQLCRVFVLIGSSFAIMLLPALSDRFARGVACKTFMLKTMGAYALIVCLGLVGIACTASLLVPLILGSEYQEAAGLLLPLGGAAGAMTVTSLLGTYFLAAGVYRVFILPIVFVGIEIGAITVFHASAWQIAVSVLVVQLVLSASMLACVFGTERPAVATTPCDGRAMQGVPPTTRTRAADQEPETDQ